MSIMLKLSNYVTWWDFSGGRYLFCTSSGALAKVNKNTEQMLKSANIFAPLITTVGICVSFWFSKKTLDQVRKDRILSQRPYLLFEQGGMADKVVYVKNGRRSPGYNPKTVEIVKKDIPEL